MIKKMLKEHYMFGIFKSTYNCSEIHQIIKSGDLDKFNDISNSSHDDCSQIGKWNGLTWAVYHVEILKAYLKVTGTGLINHLSDKGTTLLILSINNKKYASVGVLIRAGADINLADGNTDTPLIKVSGRNPSLDVVKYLIKCKVNLDLVNRDGNCALRFAVGWSNVDILRELLNAGANMYIKCNEGKNILEHAIDKESILSVKELIKAGFDLNLQNDSGKHSLIYASENNSNIEIVKELIKAGADLDLAQNNGASALIVASAESNNIEIVKELIKAGANLNATTNIGNTALILATNCKSNGVVKELISAGAELNLQGEENKSAIMFAAGESNNIEISKELIKAGANLDLVHNNGSSALFFAAGWNHIEILKDLIKAGADSSLVNDEKNNLLSHAIKHQHSEVIKELLNNSVDLGYENSSLMQKISQAEVTLSRTTTLKLLEITFLNLEIVLRYESNEVIDSSYNLKNQFETFLGIDNFTYTIENGFLHLKVYKNSPETKLFSKLTINSQAVVPFDILSENGLKYILFEAIEGVSINEWNLQKNFIQDILKTKVDIEVYDESHDLYNPSYCSRKLIILKESLIGILPKELNLGGKFLKESIESNRTQYYFSDISKDSYSSWVESIEEIKTFLLKQVSIKNYNTQKQLLILEESVEEILPTLLGLEDSSSNTPKLLHIKNIDNNKYYFYSFLPEITLRNWQNALKLKNLKILFNKPENVYDLEVYNKNSSLYDETFSNEQMIVIKELSKVPTKEELFNIEITDELIEESIFWGFGSGNMKYNTNINDTSHLMVIGGTGSGKSNFMNGIILSLLNNLDRVGKLYLIDLKTGIEFNKYRDLNSPKIEVFSKGTKATKLLDALLEVEAEMYLREIYLSSLNNIAKLNDKPIYVIIDEFAQIDLMRTSDSTEKEAKSEILNTILRIGTRARASNIKLYIQTQDPRTVGNDLKKHLLSRVLLKTSSENDREQTLQQPTKLDEMGISHTSFDKGRFVFEDYNDGDTQVVELQFPFIEPSKNLHLNYKDLARVIDDSLELKLEDFVEEVKSEYEYLSKTKILNKNTPFQDKKEEPEVVAEEYKKESKLPKKRERKSMSFDLDDILGEKKEEEDPMLKIKAIDNEAKNILQELSAQREG
ncbi:MAG: DUF87 domain-containing protein [Helicobacteraceae bacterium]|nr:DUF87 domain-containing protein [Helicobacteraceae bacterium]